MLKVVRRHPYTIGIGGLVIAAACIYFIVRYPYARYGDALARVQAAGGEVVFDGDDRRGEREKRLSTWFDVPKYGLARDVILVGDQVTDRDVSALSTLATQLQSVTLGGTGITDRAFDSLQAAPVLSDLELSCPKLTTNGFRHIPAFTHLVRLSVAFGQFGDVELAPIVAMPNLKYLQLHGVQAGDRRFAEWKRSLQLMEIQLEFCAVDDAGLKRLSAIGFPNVSRLSVRGNKGVTDAGANALRLGFPRLRKLNIADTGVSDAGAAALVKRLPKVSVVTNDVLARVRSESAELKQLTKELRAEPMQPEKRRRRGELLMQRGELKAALQDFDDTLAHVDSDSARLARAKCLAAMGAFSDATKDCDVLLIKRPSDASLLHLRAVLRIRSNDVASALNDLEKAAAIAPDDVAIAHDRAVALQMLGERKAAIDVLAAAIETSPSSHELRITIAEELLEEGRIDEVIEHCTVVLDADAYNLNALQIRSEARRRRGDSVGAKADFDLATQVSGQ